MILYKEDLVERVSEKTDIAKSDITAVLNTMLSEMENTLAQQGSVVMTNFGTFRVSKRAMRAVTSFQGDVVNVPEHVTVTFKPGTGLRTAVNKGPDVKRKKNHQ